MFVFKEIDTSNGIKHYYEDSELFVIAKPLTDDEKSELELEVFEIQEQESVREKLLSSDSIAGFKSVNKHPLLKGDSAKKRFERRKAISQKILEKTIIGWGGVKDESGNDVEFSTEKLLNMMSIYPEFSEWVNEVINDPLAPVKGNSEKN